MYCSPLHTHSPPTEIVSALSKFLLCHGSLSIPCFRGGGYFTYLQGPLAAKIQTFRGLDKPVKEPIEALALSPDSSSVHYHPFFPVTV